MTDFTGRGDPLKSITLLWRTATKTGRSGLTIDTVVDAAIALADDAGIEKLSMRKIADRLGVGAMSLYAHVPGKAELIDLMVDRVNAEAYEGTEAIPAGIPWREAIRDIAETNWKQLAAHRWLLGINDARPPLGPGTIAKYDAELRPLDGIGLDDTEMDQVLALVIQHVRSTARLSLGVAHTAEQTGSTDRQWWSVAGPVLAGLISAERFPYASRVGNAAGTDYGGASSPESSYTFGLQVILDGVQNLIDRRRRQS